MTPPVAISQRKAATALGLSRKTLARMVHSGRLRTVPGSTLLITDQLVLEFGPSARERIAQLFLEKANRGAPAA
jgi:excisionase family DNA binding protein